MAARRLDRITQTNKKIIHTAFRKINHDIHKRAAATGASNTTTPTKSVAVATSLEGSIEKLISD